MTLNKMIPRRDASAKAYRYAYPLGLVPRFIVHC
jgi:hypothetical protein